MRGKSAKRRKSQANEKTKINEYDRSIAKNISLNYNICHHCKQRKPLEALTKCKASDNAKLEAPSKHFVVNNTTVFRSKNSFFFNFIRK